MSQSDSIYLPPRAGWRKRFRSPWYSLRRGLRLERLEGRYLSFADTLRCFFLPGYSLWLFQRPRAGRIVVAIYVAALALLFVRLGYAEGTLGYSVMISLHASSLAYVIQRLYMDEPLRQRVMRVLLVALCLLLFLYIPVQTLVLPRFLVPMRIRGKVVVVHTGVPPAHQIKRGDWIAYQIPDTGGAGYRIRGGVSMEMVRGVAGDRLVFLGKEMEINGKREPKPDFLPETGEWVVPANSWFIWPGLVVARGGHAPVQLVDAQQQLAIVHMDQYVGTAFKRWFWRQQVPL